MGWNSEAGHVRGTIKKRITSAITFKGYTVHASKEDLNQDEWLAPEDWVQDLKIAKNGKLVVYAGPVYGDAPRTIKPTGRDPAEIPAAFFKVVAFINNGADYRNQEGQLDVRAFLMYQDEAAIADRDGRKTFDFQSYQVTIREIELLTGLDFPDQVYEQSSLLQPERRSSKPRSHELPRTHRRELVSGSRRSRREAGACA